jgi:dienelactone hydrolase
MNSRRLCLLTASALGFCFQAHAAEGIPQSVTALWSDFDPRRDPIEAEVIREWKEDGAVLRHVRYFIGSFKGKAARMAAVYGFPEGTKEKLPAVMHIHGGGQRGSLSEVKLLVARGYAALSVNWGGSGNGKPPFNACEKAVAGDPNTDWGIVDPTQLNAGRYSSILPGPKQLFEDCEHPKNNNWYLLTLGCRRALTFLEQQPEVDAQRLGVHGYSMGGNLTMYIAGTDDRVKAAVPAVGGSGWRWQEHVFIGGKAPLDHIQGDIDLYRRTLGFESYAPLIQCPVLHRSATNDFHGWMDDVYRTNALIVKQPLRYSWTPHMNHHLTPEVAISMPLWFDHYLKGGPALPATPHSELRLKSRDDLPTLQVRPDSKTLPVARVVIYYSVDPDPRARFWRSAKVQQEAEGYSARLPVHSLDLPLFAFANIYYTLPKPESLAQLPGYSKPVTELCISSQLHTHTATEVKQAGPRLTAQPSKVIEDFAHGLRDWYELNAGNLTHHQRWTRKISDPLYRGPQGSKLALTVKMPQTNRLNIVLQQNEWRSYRGPRRTFVCTREIPGSDSPQTLSFALSDFTSPEGSPTTWAQMDQLGLCPHFGAPANEAPLWKGPAPEFLKLVWD